MLMLKLVHAVLGLAFVGLFFIGSIQFYVGDPRYIGTLLLAALCVGGCRLVFLEISKREAGYVVHQRTWWTYWWT